jgi:putative addiction module component (TIGR02574 family)
VEGKRKTGCGGCGFAGNVKKIGLSIFLDYLFGMGMTVEQIAEEALALPSESRVLLADKLVESLDTAALSRTDEAWLAEAKRRRDDVRSGRVQTIPGDQGLAKVRRSMGQ